MRVPSLVGWHVEVSIVGGLELFWWHAAEGGVQPSGVVPVGPGRCSPTRRHRGCAAVRPKGAVVADRFVLEQPDRRLGDYQKKRGPIIGFVGLLADRRESLLARTRDPFPRWWRG
jgi:hypothetical protein